MGLQSVVIDDQVREEFGLNDIIELRTNESKPFIIFFKRLYELTNKVLD